MFYELLVAKSRVGPERQAEEGSSREIKREGNPDDGGHSGFLNCTKQSGKSVC